MNQAGIDVLIQAGLSGHRQGYGRMHSKVSNQDCALGVLHLTMHATRNQALQCDLMFNECPQLMDRYEITRKESDKIIRLNDSEHLDFIGIARKLEGHTER